MKDLTVIARGPPRQAPIEPSTERAVVDLSAVVERRLYLLRHAKSSWKDEGLADHDRPLARRGRRAAKAMGRHLREQEVEPELVLCSTARRARETLEGVAASLGPGAIRIEPGLYGAGPDGLLARLHGIAPPIGSVMVIGHNPALEQLVLLLARRGSTVQSSERSSRPARSPRSHSAVLAGPPSITARRS
jgi:phosphohistidine phosphatase